MRADKGKENLIRRRRITEEHGLKGGVEKSVKKGRKREKKEKGRETGQE